MKNILTKIRNKTIGFFYAKIFKPLAFRQDPEDVHDKILKIGKILGSNFITRFAVKIAFSYSNPVLEQNILGINFKNPVGLSAGFDKNAELTQIIPSVGFGFMEVGSITGEYCEGNPKPRLWRMPKSKSLVVWYGLKNDGCEAISKRLASQAERSGLINKKFKIPAGISVAKTNSPETVDVLKGIADYIKSAKTFYDAGIGDYFTINISCPNAFGGQPFTDPNSLELLLTEFDKLQIKKPVFLKLPPDLSFETVDKIIEVMKEHDIQGFICANLTKKRDNPKIIKEDLEGIPEGVGGISGKPAEETANNLISYIYKKTGGKYVIIGCGGIFNAEDAYKKIKAGANLLQMITGMVFLGPQVISEINRGLAELIKKDGYKNISEAIGKNLIQNI